MKHVPFRLSLSCSIYLAALAGLSDGAAGGTPTLRWETTGFHAPESIVYDAVNGCYYVSNLATRGKERTPGDGFISKVDLDGTMITREWATGLEDPKGLAVANGRLYVGDTPALFAIDLASGEIVGRHAPADGGPGQFNDCTADPLGHVYVYSARLKTVFRLTGDRLEAWHEVDAVRTGGVNGLRAESERLLLGGWNVTTPDGQQELGRLNVIRFLDQQTSQIGNTPVAHIDGIEPDGLGGYTVTDWPTGEVKHVMATGEVHLLLSLARGTADHEYLIEQELMLIPSMLEDTVRAFSWSPLSE